MFDNILDITDGFYINDIKDLGRWDPLDFEKHICHSNQNTKIFLLFQTQTYVIWNKILVTKNSLNTKMML